MAGEPGYRARNVAVPRVRIKCSSWNLIGQLASGDRSGGDHFLPCEGDCVKEGLHRGLAEGPAALMRPILVVACDPGVEVCLQLRKGAIDPLAEGHPIELVQHGLVEALD